MDGIEFSRQVARFSNDDVAYIVDVLRGAYSIISAGDNEACELLDDFITALNECDCIEIVEDEDFLVDEG